MVPVGCQSMEASSSANRAEPAAKATLSPLAAEFSPGLSVAEVTAAWSGAAAAWDRRPTTNPSGLAESESSDGESSDLGFDFT